MTSTRGRQVVIVLTNKSGGSVAAGDVVILDSANNEAFTTTTTGRAEVSIGIAQEAIASNATGRVLVAGYAALVNVPASVTRSHYLETHTVVKQATGNSTRRSGSAGQFLTSSATPSAVLWGQTDQTASGGGTISSSSAYATGTTNVGGSANTYTDISGLSLTLAAGSYFLIASVIMNTGATNLNVTLRLWDGTTVVHEVELSIMSGGQRGEATLFGIVTPGSSTTYKVSFADTVGGNNTIARSQTNENGTANKASHIDAIKFA